MIRSFKIIVDKHADGYVAYRFGLKGVAVGEGNNYEEALLDVKSAIAFHEEIRLYRQRSLWSTAHLKGHLAHVLSGRHPALL